MIRRNRLLAVASTWMFSILPLTNASASAGRWERAADMPTLYGDTHATLLLDGRVLVVGVIGTDICELFRGIAEVYDPNSGTWTTQADMIRARGTATAVTRLLDGRVLLAGGEMCAGAQGYITSEIFDPASGTWTQTGNLNFSRRLAQAVTLMDGRVLLAGGGPSQTSANAELYDPVTTEWTITDRMATGRSGHSMILLQDGRVLVAGGFGSSHSSEVYDPATETWTRVGDMTEGREYFPLTLLPDGRVFATDGRTSEVYDPALQAWTQTARSSFFRSGPFVSATLLLDGTVLVAGGDSGAISQVFDPSTDTWQLTGPMLAPRRNSPSATLLNDGSVLVAGGSYYAPPCSEGLCTWYPLTSSERFIADFGN